MERVLIYSDEQDGSAVVLEVDGDHVQETLDTCGRNIRDWPEDLDAYRRQGLYVWEGTPFEDDFSGGTLRPLTHEEYLRCNQQLRVLV